MLRISLNYIVFL